MTIKPQLKLTSFLHSENVFFISINNFCLSDIENLFIGPFIEMAASGTRVRGAARRTKRWQNGIDLNVLRPLGLFVVGQRERLAAGERNVMESRVSWRKESGRSDSHSFAAAFHGFWMIRPFWAQVDGVAELICKVENYSEIDVYFKFGRAIIMPLFVPMPFKTNS